MKRTFIAILLVAALIGGIFWTIPQPEPKGVSQWCFQSPDEQEWVCLLPQGNGAGLFHSQDGTLFRPAIQVQVETELHDDSQFFFDPHRRKVRRLKVDVENGQPVRVVIDGETFSAVEPQPIEVNRDEVRVQLKPVPQTQYFAMPDGSQYVIVQTVVIEGDGNLYPVKRNLLIIKDKRVAEQWPVRADVTFGDGTQYFLTDKGLFCSEGQFKPREQFADLPPEELLRTEARKRNHVNWPAQGKPIASEQGEYYERV